MMKLVVLTCLVAAAKASGIIAPFAPLAYTAAPYIGGYTGFAYPGFNYRGPLSLAPGQPASILAADGRPLDTLDVNLDKSAHFTAKALEGSGIRLLKKRSAPLFAAPLAAPLAAAPLAAPLAAAPLALPYAGINYATPYAYTPYSGFGYTGYSAPLAYLK